MLMENLNKAMSFLGALIKKSIILFVVFVFIFFLLYSVKTVVGINLFEDLSIEDFFGFLLSIFTTE
jgi:hypothetical protein